MMKNNYYVYIHRRKDNNNIFYVGKGKGQRAFDFRRRSDWWLKIVDKAKGFVVEIVSSGISEQEAFDLEHKLIMKYGRIKFEKDGILCNLTNGYDGLSGMKHSESTKELMRRKALGRNSISDEGRKRIALSNKNRDKNIEGIKKGALKRLGENNVKSKIILNIESGVFHYTLTEASKTYGININTLSDHLRGARLCNKTNLIYA